MRTLAPRPVLLVLTLVLVAGAIAFIELRLDAVGAEDTGAGGAQANADPPTDEEQTEPAPQRAKEKGVSAASKGREKERPGSPGTEKDSSSSDRGVENRAKPTVSDAERISRKEETYQRAEEIRTPSGIINTDGVSVREAVGEKVILLEFWTYTCFNCRNAQPHINALHEEYADEGLLVVGVHTPEFGFEKDIDNVRDAVRRAGIEYPVVLDNSYGTWNAYDQRFWPAWYLIDADGFVRYKHFGEGAYGETEEKIKGLLAERDRISG